MPYSQERPMRHIFLVEVSSWSENQIRWTKQRHLVMLEMGLFFHGSDGLNERDENKNCNKSCCMVFGTWIERQRSRCETNVKCTHEVWNITPGLDIFWAQHFGGSAEVEKEWLVTLATINPSEVEYEEPSAADFLHRIRPVSMGWLVQRRTLCLVHGDWPSNWRSLSGRCEDISIDWGGGRAYLWTSDILVKVLPILS